MSSRDDGIYFGVPREEYDAIQRVNWSTLRHLDLSPAHYLAALNGDDADTAARKLGRCKHTAVLEPDLCAQTMAVWTGGRRAGKEWDAFCAANAGKELLTEEEAWRVALFAQAIRLNPAALPCFADGASEVTVLWTHQVVPGVEVQCKARLDYLNEHGLADLKSTRCAKPAVFAADSYRRLYHAQMAMYADGLARIEGRRRPVRIVAREDEAPLASVVYRLPDEVLAAGRAKVDELLAKLAWCRSEGKWPGYEEAEVDLMLPRWAWGETELLYPTNEESAQ